MDGQLRDVDVEEALVGAVGRSACPEGRGQDGQHAAVEFEGGRVGSFVKPADFVASFFGGADDDEGAAAAKREFGDGVGVGIASDLDSASDNVTSFVLDGLAVAVGVVGSSKAAVLGEKAKDFGGKDRLGLAEAEKLV